MTQVGGRGEGGGGVFGHMSQASQTKTIAWMKTCIYINILYCILPAHLLLAGCGAAHRDSRRWARRRGCRQWLSVVDGTTDRRGDRRMADPLRQRAGAVRDLGSERGLYERSLGAQGPWSGSRACVTYASNLKLWHLHVHLHVRLHTLTSTTTRAARWAQSP